MWLADTLVIYVCFWDTTLASAGDWKVMRKVAGTPKTGTQIGTHRDLATAQHIAETDAEELQNRGL
jgi:hypothetical protein